MMYKVTITLKVVTTTKTRCFLVSASNSNAATKLVQCLVSEEWAEGTFAVEEVALCMELRSTHSAAIPS